MNIEEFYNYVDNTNLLSGEAVTELEAVLNEFPYFVAGKFVYLKNQLKSDHATAYEDLKREVIYLPDRKKIFVNPQNDQAKGTDFKQIDEFLSARGATNEANTLPERGIGYDYFSLMEKENDLENIPEWEHLDSFIADTERINRLRDNANDNVLTELDMPLPTANFLPTETLANLYIKQEKYEQALEIFEALRLKYPEKEGYFASRIRDLEKVIIRRDIR
ncbi:MAG: hypothetical protein LBT73_03205 [Tannerellaceae bacterium]|jgi:tetratricopeptide (TPR) repeat protein|nr:hypothetical protein [Tannerellaceae bacterium]